MVQILFCAPKQKRTLVRTACTRAHTHTLRHTHSHSREVLWQGGLAIGSNRIFPGGPINNGPMDRRFIYLFVCLFTVLRRFSVNTVKKMRDWQKKKLSFGIYPMTIVTGPGCLVEEGRRLVKSLR